MAEFKAPTEQEFDSITRRTAQRMRHQLLAVAARFDRRAIRLMITLNNGAIVGFPLSVLPGLEQATPDDLRKIEVEGSGHGLHVPSLEADISVPTLLADQLGSTIMRRAVARANASKANGRLGGRPRRTKAAWAGSARDGINSPRHRHIHPAVEQPSRRPVKRPAMRGPDAVAILADLRGDRQNPRRHADPHRLSSVRSQHLIDQ
jgi:hypothetical protein